MKKSLLKRIGIFFNLELNNNRPGSFYKLSYIDDEVTSPAIYFSNIQKNPYFYKKFNL